MTRLGSVSAVGLSPGIDSLRAWGGWTSGTGSFDAQLRGGSLASLWPVRIAAAALALAAFPALAAWRAWPARGGTVSDISAGQAGAAGIAFFAAGLMALPLWTAPLIGLALLGVSAPKQM